MNRSIAGGILLAAGIFLSACGAGNVTESAQDSTVAAVQSSETVTERQSAGNQETPEAAVTEGETTEAAASEEEFGPIRNIAPFNTKTIEGDAFTEKNLEDYDLTMVNVFATWCGPCVAEMPELEKLHQEMSGQKFNILGVCLDAMDMGGENPDAIQKAKDLQSKLGITYPIVIPDSTALNGRLIGIMAIPETFFVDKNGKIVGDTYSGARSMEQWKEIVEKEIANLQ